MGYAQLSLVSSTEGISVVKGVCIDAVKGNGETEKVVAKLKNEVVYFRLTVREGAQCTFSYSLDGKDFITIPDTFQAQPGRWIGAKVGLFCTRTAQTNDSGYADVDWFSVEAVK